MSAGARAITSKLAFAFPKVAFLESALTKETSPEHLRALKRQIWHSRSEYWIRKVTTYGQVVQAAKGESKQVIRKLANPREWTGADATRALLFGVQVFGCFCIGEMIGRESFVGYPVGDYHHPTGRAVPGLNNHH